MAPTNAKFLRRAMCEGFLIISLGGCYFQKYRVELFTEVVNSYSPTKISRVEKP
jgi:hypothetical protein